MPLTPIHIEHNHEHLHLPHPHIGMRKVKSIIAIFIGFCLWQFIRLFIPELEVHPLFIYIYGLIEIRETSDKTTDYGKMRIMATFTAIAIGVPFMALMDYLEGITADQWNLWIEIVLILVGALIVLCVAEWVKCRIYCGLAAAIYMILLITHIDTSMYLYSIMRAFQTIIGVSIAWFINVKVLPYPPKPGSLSEKWMIWWEMKKKKSQIMSNKEIKYLKNNPTMEGQVKLVQHVIYSTATGIQLPLTLLLPWNLDNPYIKKEKKPLIVYVQGSAWTTPDRDFQIPQLSEFARKGYIIATLDHRNALLGNAFPAYLQDVKCAIRFLRKNADMYGIDPERVAIWGTSSGGNAALLVGLTGDDPEYKTDEYAEYSDKVQAVVECFGPTDLIAMNGTAEDEDYAISDIQYILNGLCGGDMSRYTEVAAKMSPVNYVMKEKDVPPFLLLHGDADPIVPFEQMTLLLDKMLECGYDVEAWRIEGAEHEGTFWSQEVYEVIERFIDNKVSHL